MSEDVPMQLDDPEDIFHYTQDTSTEGYIIYNDEDTGKDEVVRYYDPAEDIPENDKFGRATLLTMNCAHFIRATNFHGL